MLKIYITRCKNIALARIPTKIDYLGKLHCYSICFLKVALKLLIGFETLKLTNPSKPPFFEVADIIEF